MINFSNNNYNLLYIFILFSTSIITVIGIHIKYGLFLGMDAFAEYAVIKDIAIDGFFSRSVLADFPLSYISVVICNLLTGLPLVFFSWNAIHLITNAGISVVIYLIINKIFDSKIAILSSFIVAFHPTHVILGLSMTRENFALLLLLFAIYIIIIKFQKEITPSHTILFIIFTVGFILSHYTSSYYGLLIIIILITSFYIVSRKSNMHSHSFYLLFPTVALLSWWSYSIIQSTVTEVASNYISRMYNFISFNIGLHDPTHNEVTRIMDNSDITMVIFRLQAFFIVIGSLIIIYLIFRKKMNHVQIAFSIVALFSTVLLCLWYLIPDLSQSFYISRILRYTILFNCINISMVIIYTVGYVTRHLSNIFLSYRKKDVEKTISFIVIVLLTVPIFVYPISENVTRYIGFTDSAYPSELTDEMYNIRSTNEMWITKFIGEKTPSDTTIIMEMPLSRMKNYLDFQSPRYMMDFDNLFNNNDSFILIRKSLYAERQFIHGPVGLDAAYVAQLDNDNFSLLNRNLVYQQIIYSQSSYKLYYRNYY